jgi:TolB-like protein/cytochrome c-type biogenesis protein CcmH/NrfG
MSEGTQRRLAAIVAADVVGYSRLMGADEDGTLAALRSHRAEVIDGKIAEHGGRIVKTMGDGLLLEFPSVVDATQCVIEVQQGMAERNQGVDESRRIIFRIGVNLGDIIIEGDDILGDGVNIAARLESLCEPGGMAISNRVHEDVRDRLDAVFTDAGEQTLKNIARPVRIWHWSPTASMAELLPVEAPLALPDKPSIAVLPFDNMSGDPEQEYFSDGISEDIITSLSKLSNLAVIARNSSFTYKGRSEKIQEIAKELGVRYVVEGSVRKAGNRVRITAQLIEGSTSTHLWAERYDRELTDIFAVQDEVTQEIVSAMAVKLTSDEQERLKNKGTDNLEAYDYVLRAQEQHGQFTKEGNRQAEALCKRAIDLDPDYATAYARLALVHLTDYVNQWSETVDLSLDRTCELAQKAVALDETNATAHSALGFGCLWKRQHEQAITEFERSTALEPSSARGHIQLALAHHYAGSSEKAIELFNRGMRLDPHFSDILLHWLAQAYFQLGRYEEAVDLIQRRLILKPDTDNSRVLLAASFGHLGQVDEAEFQWAEVFRINPNYSLEHRVQTLPYKDPADFDRVVEGLRKAGLPGV